jgi:hypothetical protein
LEFFVLIPKHDKTLRRMLDSRLKKLGSTSPILAATLSSYSYRVRAIFVPLCR